MMEYMTQLATNSSLPLLVLAAAGIIVVVEAFGASRTALWGDMFVEDLED